MKVIVFLISSFFLLSAEYTFADKVSYKKKVSRKVASVFQSRRGNKVFSKLMKCKNVEKNKEYFSKVTDCMSKYFQADMSQAMKVDLVIFILHGSKFSSLSKCDYEVLEDHPSVVDHENDFVLCSDYLKGKRERKRTAIFFFDQRGDKLEILDVRD
ncbi:hypothetical protein A9Q84_08335 [Halobacteriovorax marinus]|uniref:Lipoprotein n=1 Tax=Halobacteriovorax marinus TaxID=97084 RepID=A0A1Y5F637_9BACT|nr:hypothetical protein A9Q84_08335 [Halobacteriovorax marinus]